MKIQIVRIGIVLLMSCSAATSQDKADYSILSAQSSLEIRVEKNGFLKALGHNHLILAKQISGTVQFDQNKIENSAVILNVETNSLIVAPGSEPEKDLADVQAAMSGEKVLNVMKYPQITFSSTGVSAVKAAKDGWNLTLSGTLKLHGIEKPVTLPITLHTNGRELEAQGEVSLLQSEYGITPIRIGGGAVTVKDKLIIKFAIAAGK